MAKKKNRRQTELCVSTLRDLFLQNILENRKYTTFLKLVNHAKQNGEDLGDETLVNFFIEDVIHRKYGEFIAVIINFILNY